MSAATFGPPGGAVQRVVKGAAAAVFAPVAPTPAAAASVTELERRGLRVLAVASGPPTAMALSGFIALGDPPRPDAAALVEQLAALGVRTLMVTGDSALTVAAVAHAVGLGGKVGPPGPIPASIHAETFDVFAGVLPEDKYQLVKALQQGRITFQRIQTYTLNSISSKILQVMLLAVGLLVTGQAILTPLLMVIIMITGGRRRRARVRDRGIANAGIRGHRVRQSGQDRHQPRTPLVWASRPSGWLVASSVVDVAIASILAVGGVAMTALPAGLVAATLACAAACTFVLDAIKVPMLRRLALG